MPVSFDTFERLKDRGLSLYKAGDYVAAKPFLMQAAEAMIQIAAQEKDPARRVRRKAMAAELIEFAGQCDTKAADKKANRGRAEASGEDGEATKASDWIVKEKPDIGFDDIAGLEECKHEIRMKMIYP